MFASPIVNAFLTLSLIVGGLWGVLLLIKRINGRSKNSSSPINLNIISRVSLQPKTHLYLVKAGQKTLLIGVTDHNISTLADLTEETQAPQVPASEYKALVARANNVSRAKAPEASNADIDESLTFGAFLKSAFKRN
jgi:flagellar biosynthetic protein FliO